METSASSRTKHEEVEIHGEPDPGPSWARARPVCRWPRSVASTASARRPTYYQWKSKYAGMSANEVKRTKELKAENSRLKRMYAELAPENAAIKNALSREL